jgi:hypothetical protein
MYESFLAYRGARYSIVAVAATVLCILIFMLHSPTEPRNGGTWLGYTLGTVGALLIVWLSWFGVRKRAYQSRLGSVEGWLSAHVYFGAALLIIATLHSAGEIGWNVHSLSYVLMCIVILSGFYGVYLYRIFPRRMSLNLAGSTREDITVEIALLDRRCKQLTKHVTGDVQAVVTSALERTSLGTTMTGKVFGRDSSMVMLAEAEGQSPRLVNNAYQHTVLEFLSGRIAFSRGGAEAVALRDLIDLFSDRRRLLTVLRRDAQMREQMRFWLFLHVPVTIALLAALAVHILSVFLYW